MPIYNQDKKESWTGLEKMHTFNTQNRYLATNPNGIFSPAVTSNIEGLTQRQPLADDSN